MEKSKLILLKLLVYGQRLGRFKRIQHRTLGEKPYVQESQEAFFLGFFLPFREGSTDHPAAETKRHRVRCGPCPTHTSFETA